jgi:hypothetical protein
MGCFKVPQWSLASNSEQVSLLPISHNFVGSPDDGNLLPDRISTLTEHLGQNCFLPLA